jgi:hypothetical protein
MGMKTFADAIPKIEIKINVHAFEELKAKLRECMATMDASIPTWEAREPEPTLNRERIQMWYDALLSGKYRQIYGSLYDYSGGFCALGVAWQVYARETGNSPDPLIDINAYRTMREWFGYRHDNPDILYGAVYQGITNVNDIFHASFREIAEAIRVTYLTDEPEVTVPDSPAELVAQELVAA